MAYTLKEEMAYVAEYYESYTKSRASKELKAMMAEKAKLYRQYEREASISDRQSK